MNTSTQRIEKILWVLVLLILVVSVSATYYKYIVLEDFVIETKPMEDFTEDDF